MLDQPCTVHEQQLHASHTARESKCTSLALISESGHTHLHTQACSTLRAETLAVAAGPEQPAVSKSVCSLSAPEMLGSLSTRQPLVTLKLPQLQSTIGDSEHRWQTRACLALDHHSDVQRSRDLLHCHAHNMQDLLTYQRSISAQLSVTM